MYYEQTLAVDRGPTNTGLALIDGDELGFSFNVQEDFALVEVAFEGTCTSTAGAQLDLAFSIDGDATPTLLLSHDIAAGGLAYISVRRVYRLARGVHTVELFGESSVAAADTLIAGATAPASLSVKILSNNNVVAANDNAKRQGVY